MVGSALVRLLSDIKGVEILITDRREVDLRDAKAVEIWARNNRPELAFMAAATVGGILANDSRPVDFLKNNLEIELATIGAAFESGVEKFLFLGSSCIYPKNAQQPIREDSLLTAPLEPTNQWYAIAKIAGIMLCDAYRKQFGAGFISAMPTNLYGPNDNFNLHTSHVLPATIRKISEAVKFGKHEVTIWGTGSPLREFMHVDDLADALVFVMRHYNKPGPINIGSGQEISILGLYELIAKILGWNGTFLFDKSKPDGTPRKLMDSSLLTSLGWAPKISLEQGIKCTIGNWNSTKIV